MLTGNSGANVLNGGTGADVMRGGSGNDTYYVDNAGDNVDGESSASGGGVDTVMSVVTYSAASDFVENITLTGTAGINATGNQFANVLTGNSGANVLNGGTGADVMRGEGGNDTYVVDNAKDNVDGETSGEGVDTVQSSITWSLATDAYLENLTLTGSAAINATGNGLANVLTGNTGANVLDGGTGADTMAGGTGSDTYYVDNAKDGITGESSASSGGVDKVFSSVSFSLAGDYVEQLALTGTSSINATGNGMANLLTGNSGKNVLLGDAGNDTLQGGAGADSMTGGAGAERFAYMAAADSTTSARDVITDFLRGTDKIDLSQFDANAGKSGLQDFTFIGSQAFSANATGQLRFAIESGKVMLYGSTDADTTAEFAVQVGGATTLAASDFLF
ncbi:calcium-binding protein [Ramlibacter terrae]|uniref:Calcium-binding protein n=1 Tax=Ramlibacter terrae TaxID=2732511 RepID=A0ABX6P0S7_9BURK|nr:calcium-binding protein [Ramlibacter terrae]